MVVMTEDNRDKLLFIIFPYIKREMEELIDLYLELANNYINLKYYEKAKQILLKAKKFSPTKEIIKTLAKVDFLIGQSTNQEHIKGANKCECCGFGSHPPGRTCPASKSSCYNCGIIGHWDNVCWSTKESSEDENSEHLDYKLKIIAECKKELAELCMQLAVTYTKNNSKKAKEFILKAKKLSLKRTIKKYPIEEIDTLVDKICTLDIQDEETKSENNFNKDEQFHSYSSTSRTLGKLEKLIFQQCFINIRLVQNHVTNKRYEEAKKLLLKVKSLHSTSSISKKLAEVEKLISEQREEEDRKYSMFVQLAEDCISSKKYKEAKNFLLKAKSIRSNSGIDKRLKELEQLVYQHRNEEQYKFSNEMNKDEAEKCFQIAKTCIVEKDYEKAEKFLLKAKKLYASEKIHALLDELSNAPKCINERTDFYKENPTEKKETYNYRDDVNKEEAERCVEIAAGFINQQNYMQAEKFLHMANKLFPMNITDEMLRKIEKVGEVNRVLACRFNDYYAILQVNKYVSYDDLKKAYKILALNVHPDKNNAPRADEAFKRVLKAFQVLSSKWNKRGEILWRR